LNAELVCSRGATAPDPRFHLPGLLGSGCRQERPHRRATNVIREDRELLTELARLNTAMAPLAMRIMDGTASAAEQQDYARRLITAGQWLHRRAARIGATIINGQVVTNAPFTHPGHAVESYRES
jgi:hypothetical protein